MKPVGRAIEVSSHHHIITSSHATYEDEFRRNPRYLLTAVVFYFYKYVSCELDRLISRYDSGQKHKHRLVLTIMFNKRCLYFRPGAYLLPGTLVYC